MTATRGRRPRHDAAGNYGVRLEVRYYWKGERIRKVLHNSLLYVPRIDAIRDSVTGLTLWGASADAKRLKPSPTNVATPSSIHFAAKPVPSPIPVGFEVSLDAVHPDTTEGVPAIRLRVSNGTRNDDFFIALTGTVPEGRLEETARRFVDRLRCDPKAVAALVDGTIRPYAQKIADAEAVR
jgi:hypothetical protein